MFQLKRGDRVKLLPKNGKPEMLGIVVDRLRARRGETVQYAVDCGLDFWVWRGIDWIAIAK